ncbi:hypothetical protein BDQ17DRAFT_231754 [Cyathus striatus]|nr:hypothetical protein BDQ17DRAFT_231754 [Cyathus striatus]
MCGDHELAPAASVEALLSPTLELVLVQISTLLPSRSLGSLASRSNTRPPADLSFRECLQLLLCNALRYPHPPLILTSTIILQLHPIRSKAWSVPTVTTTHSVKSPSSCKTVHARRNSTTSSNATDLYSRHHRQRSGALALPKFWSHRRQRNRSRTLLLLRLFARLLKLLLLAFPVELLLSKAFFEQLLVRHRIELLMTPLLEQLQLATVLRVLPLKPAGNLSRAETPSVRMLGGKSWGSGFSNWVNSPLLVLCATCRFAKLSVGRLANISFSRVRRALASKRSWLFFCCRVRGFRLL